VGVSAAPPRRRIAFADSGNTITDTMAAPER